HATVAVVQRRAGHVPLVVGAAQVLTVVVAEHQNVRVLGLVAVLRRGSARHVGLTDQKEEMKVRIRSAGTTAALTTAAPTTAPGAAAGGPTAAGTTRSNAAGRASGAQPTRTTHVPSGTQTSGPKTSGAYASGTHAAPAAHATRPHTTGGRSAGATAITSRHAAERRSDHESRQRRMAQERCPRALPQAPPQGVPIARARRRGALENTFLRPRRSKFRVAGPTTRPTRRRRPVPACPARRLATVSLRRRLPTRELRSRRRGRALGKGSNLAERKHCSRISITMSTNARSV